VAVQECDCICGGRNHGARHRQAVENTGQLLVGRAELTGELSTLQGIARRNGLDPGAIHLHAKLPLLA
jgi:hypothetical protein